MTRPLANPVEKETNTLLPMAAPTVTEEEESTPRRRSKKLLWLALAVTGVALVVAIWRISPGGATSLHQKYGENPAAIGLDYNIEGASHEGVYAEIEGKYNWKHWRDNYSQKSGGDDDHDDDEEGGSGDNAKVAVAVANIYEGESKKEKKKEKQKKKALAVCEDGKYSKRTLKLAYELPFASLFRDNKGQKKYEASSVILVDDNAYAVCDSSWAISKFDSQLQPFGDKNVQIGAPDRHPDDSGYEALFYADGLLYVVRESVKMKDKTYHAIIEELLMNDDDSDYKAGEKCPSEFEFEGDSKGFEGAVAVRDLAGELVVLGLCEGNYCSESAKDDTGNGRLIAMKKETLSDGSCQWSTIRTIKVPKSADFRDYSAMTVTDVGRVAISSQEESQLWVGQLLGQNPAGIWNVTEIEFDADVAKIYDFPKNGNCDTVFCNIEGVHWMNDEMILAVSDKMKSKGKQSFNCFEHDQSVHVFVLP